MALLDGDRFEGKFRDGVHTVDASEMITFLVNPDQLKHRPSCSAFGYGDFTLARPASRPCLLVPNAGGGYRREGLDALGRLGNQQRPDGNQVAGLVSRHAVQR